MSAAAPHAVLLDIEGTIGDITFVRDVLFPYARERLAPFVTARADDPEVATALAAARTEARLPAAAGVDEVVQHLVRWSDEDRKAGPLKVIQGLIWRRGYESGVLHAHLYDDAVTAIRGWASAGVKVAIYSSGSVQAQRLYMRFSTAGDLSALVTAYFDTQIGAKAEVESYRRIVDAIGLRDTPGAMTFYSDARAEVSAARDAGCGAVRIDRALERTARLRDPDGVAVRGSLLGC